MTLLGRLTIVGLAATLLAACSSTDAGTAQIWRSGTTWDAQGNATTFSTHTSEAIVEPVKGPEWDYQGVWNLEEYFAAADRLGEMECAIRLDPAPVSGGHMVTLDAECPVELRHIAAWHLADRDIVLVDAAGEAKARFAQRSGTFYRGRITLASGRKMDAFFTGYLLE